MGWNGEQNAGARARGRPRYGKASSILDDRGALNSSTYFNPALVIFYNFPTPCRPRCSPNLLSGRVRGPDRPRTRAFPHLRGSALLRRAPVRHLHSMASRSAEHRWVSRGAMVWVALRLGKYHRWGRVLGLATWRPLRLDKVGLHCGYGDASPWGCVPCLERSPAQSCFPRSMYL